MLRYIVERISDGKFLELELPIFVSGAGMKLGGAGSFAGEIAPVFDVYKFAGTDALIDPYATLIHEEADSVIRGSWLVTRCEFKGASWRVEGKGFSAYFDGRPYEGEFRGEQVDPVSVARHVVESAQTGTNADLRVRVVGGSPARVGTGSDRALSAAEEVLRAAKLAKKARTDARTMKTKEKQTVTGYHDKIIRGRQAVSRQRLEELQALRKAGSATETAQALRNAAVESVKLAQAAKKAALVPIDAALASIRTSIDSATETERKAADAVREAKEKVQEDGGAWKLLWWDTPDCLRSMQEAIDEIGYEWVEWSGWNRERTEILKEIRVMPRVGRQQNDLLFVEGDNVIESVTVESDSADYANTVVAIGAGEGKAALRVTVATASSRRRRVHVVDAKDVTKRSALEAIARSELAARSQLVSVAALRVMDHPNAEFGSFGVGDLILVDSDGTAAGRQKIWRRIEELEWVGADVVDLMLGGA